MQRSIDLTLAVLATVGSVLLSLPYWPSYSYWAVSRTAWWIYIALGAVLAVYVFYVFFRALRTMFVHEGHHGAHHHHPSERPHDHVLVTEHVAEHAHDAAHQAPLGAGHDTGHDQAHASAKHSSPHQRKESGAGRASRGDEATGQA